MSTVNFLQDYRLFDFFSKSNKITILNNGEEYIFKQHGLPYEDLLQSFLHTINNAHEMPAFGVSLHDETIKAMQEGLWLKFDFEEEQTHNEMSFSSLLINIVPDYQGFNLIREYQGRYEGRCFYLNLENDMSEIYDAIKKYIK